MKKVEKTEETVEEIVQAIVQRLLVVLLNQQPPHFLIPCDQEPFMALVNDALEASCRNGRSTRDLCRQIGTVRDAANSHHITIHDLMLQLIADAGWYGWCDIVTEVEWIQASSADTKGLKAAETRWHESLRDHTPVTPAGACGW